MSESSTSARAEISGSGDSRAVALSGRFDANTTAAVWNQLERESLPEGVEIDCKEVEYCDSAGITLLLRLEAKHHATLVNIPRDIRDYLEHVRPEELPDLRPERPKSESPPVATGRATAAFLTDLAAMIRFTGEATVGLLGALVRPQSIRWAEFWITFEKAGVNAMLIVGLIGFLTGMIMAFQSTVPLRQFGVDIFVVNLVALAMLRELGVIMTAIVFAGRSGSAFAAEIGTMKVNEEVNALTTMGLDPVRFLVTPKLLVGIVVMPILTIYANFVGVAGGLAVMMLFGHPWAAVWTQLVSAVSYQDVLAGLIKAVVFGYLIAGIGCLRGLQTKSGATAVGDSTTSAVVTSIFLIVVVDALFAVLFYATDF